MSVSVSKQGDIAVVTIDNPPVNATSAAVRVGLLQAVRDTDADQGVTAVVLHCTGRTFVAGADVKEFGSPPVKPHLPDVLDAIERAAKPWIAALHGTALGGGLELAMACHARVAALETRLGLPEVNLGLIPGAGGTVRLPRLVDPSLALTMIAGGKPIKAPTALEAGLIDKIIEGDLLTGAVALAATIDRPIPTRERPVRQPMDSQAFEGQCKNIATKARGQISPIAAVEAVQRALHMPFDQALQQERDSFSKLKSSPQSAALRHLFFAERATLKQDARAKTMPRDLTQIGIVGGGTMGAGIATACAMRGFDVLLIEQTPDAAEAAQTRISATLTKSAERGIIPDLDKALSRIRTGSDLAALSEADLVIEAVFEDLQTKKDLFQNLERVTKAEAILATNTSYLDVNDIANVLKNPARAIGLHFFSPAHIMKLLEIVLPEHVADDVVATGIALSKRLGKIGVLSGVCDGFIGNRIMSAYRREADYLVQDGAAPDAVDQAMRNFGFPMGIFEMQDLAGLDISWASRKRKAATRDPNERYVKIADRLCELGRFGRKTGKGWYCYDQDRPYIDATVKAIIDEERQSQMIADTALSEQQIMQRILGAMQQESDAVLAEGIACNGDDIDVVMVNGYGFPRWRGGPLFMRRALA